MFAYRILLFSILVIGVAANKITIDEEDWDKLIASATTLCKCTIKPIEETISTFEDCESNATNAVFNMNAASKAPIVKVCEDIKDINNKLKAAKLDKELLHTDNGTLGNHNDTNPEIIFPGDTSKNHTDEYGRVINRPEGSESNRTYISRNNGTEGLEKNSTDIGPVILNGTEVLEPNRTLANGTDYLPELYEGNTTEASPNVTERTYTSTDTNTGLIEDKNETLSSTVGSNVTQPTIEPKSNSTTEKLLQTSENPHTDSTADPAAEEKMYALSTVLITFFCSFGAGILIAVGSKILYSRYRERTYEIPAEQELH